MNRIEHSTSPSGLPIVRIVPVTLIDDEAARKNATK